MKKTLLQLTQDICSDLDFDEVNSIGDTVQSQQVASIIQSCYYEMIGHRNWPHTKQLFSLDSVSDVAKPVYLMLPENLKELVTFYYKADDGSAKELVYKEPEAFIRMVSQRKNTASNVQSVTDYSGVSFLIINDVDPTYYTSFNDKYVVVDSFNSNESATILASKTLCSGYLTPEWIAEDSFVPDLPVEAFPALFEEAKSTASFNIKQMADAKADAKSVRQQRWLSRKAWVAQMQDKYPDYGRK